MNQQRSLAVLAGIVLALMLGIVVAEADPDGLRCLGYARGRGPRLAACLG